MWGGGCGLWGGGGGGVVGQSNFAVGSRVTGASPGRGMGSGAGSPGTVGNRRSATRHHPSSIWGFSEPQSGAFKGFGFGAGLR